ncbi:ComF family protein, partial [Streptomyces sp. NPDC059783]
MRGWWREIAGLVLPVVCGGCGRPRTELCEAWGGPPGGGGGRRGGGATGRRRGAPGGAPRPAGDAR